MKTYPRRILPLLLAGVFSSALADEDIFFAELPVVGSVSRLQQRLADAPASVTVIDREMIRASGVRSLNDIFRLVPGFQTFAHSDVTARVNYHSVTDDNDYSPRVQVLVDGRSLHSPLFRGGVNWQLIPIAIEDIERIEVVRGSNTVSYGTNAFLGVINIITLDPSMVKGMSISGSSGSQGVRDYTVRGGGTFGDSGRFRVTYQETKDDGLEDSYDWKDSYLNRRFDARFDYQINNRDLLELNLGRTEGRFTSGRLDGNPPVLSDPENPIRSSGQDTSWVQAKWSRVLSDGEDISLRYSFSQDQSDDGYTYIGTRRDNGYKEVNKSGDWGRRNEIEVLHQFSPVINTRLAWGGSWRHDAVASQTMLRGKGRETREVWRGFVNSEWKPNQWLTSNLGFSNEYDSLAGNNLSPRASLAFHVTPENTLRVGFSQAWRTSSIVAYKANYRYKNVATNNDQIGNPNLPAERLDSWELAYLGDWRDWRMSLDVRHFREKLKDRLMLIRPGPRSGPTQESEQSIQDLDIRGHELQWKWQPFEQTRLLFNHASIKVSSKWSGNGERISQIGDSHLDPMGSGPRYQELADNSAPRRSSSFMLMQKLPYGFELSVARYWVNSIKWTRNTAVDKYNRTDARLAYPFSIGGQRGELAYTVQSLNGAHSEQRMPAADKPNQRTVDRRHWISLRLDF